MFEEVRARLVNIFQSYPRHMDIILNELNEVEKQITQLRAEVERLKQKTITVSVWGENWCDDNFKICSVNNIGYDEVTEMIESLNEFFDDLLLEHRECDVVLRPVYFEAQVGNYPPPNIELEAYWDFEIISVTSFEEQESETNENV